MKPMRVEDGGGTPHRARVERWTRGLTDGTHIERKVAEVVLTGPGDGHGFDIDFDHYLRVEFVFIDDGRRRPFKLHP